MKGGRGRRDGDAVVNWLAATVRRHDQRVQELEASLSTGGRALATQRDDADLDNYGEDYFFGGGVASGGVVEEGVGGEDGT